MNQPLVAPTPHLPNHLGLGIAAALGAGLLWGLVFVSPLLLANYPPLLLTFGRYLAFGLVTLPIAWWLRGALRQFSRADWRAATRLSLIGNFLYFFCLASAIQLAGAPLPTLIIGTLPVVIAVVSNLGDRQVRWRALALPLILILLGLLSVNFDQLQRLRQDGAPLGRYLLGAALAILANACWTWYPIKNAQWLRANPQHRSITWATAQGLATLPLAAFGLVVLLIYYRISGDLRFSQHWLGPQPWFFVALMLAIGFGASWLGTLLWNIASKNTPTALTGQLIVFETLAALLYAYLVYQRWPNPGEALGIALLIAGVIAGVRALSKSAPVRQKTSA